MRLILTILLITLFMPGYAYALSLSDLTKPEILAPILALLLGISELLGALDIVKPNGVVDAVIRGVVGLIKKLLGK